ncbi:MAG TPA: MFS transporter [Methylomirabilota bacterium]|nr:MFS transporter [Methylomirabilota bacterium]
MGDSRPALVKRWLGGIRPAYLPVLLTYFCYGASTVTAIALLYFEKDVLGLTPAQAAAVAFWLSLPWSMKMVAGVASDAYPILGSRRHAYLLVGAICSLVGYAALATTVRSAGAYVAVSVLIAVGFMIQDVVADALSVEIAQNDEEIGQIQTLGRMALLLGGISVGYLSGVLAGRIGSRATFAVAMVLPLLVAASVPFIRTRPRTVSAPTATTAGPLAGGKAQLVLLVGLGYAAFGALLETVGAPYSREIVLVVSAALISLLLQRVGISQGVVIAAIVIFLFRATPTVGQGYSYWAIDRLGFDQKFLGLLAQVSSILSLVGLLVFRKTIVKRPVSFTLLWVMVAGAILYLPSIGLFYGLHEWLGISARTLAFVDTTISAPLGQLAMVPMLVLIARTAPPGAEATMFAIMASLMNLALSASQLFTEYLNEAFAVTQTDYSNLGRLMITVGVVGLLPLLALPLLHREERGIGRGPAERRPEPAPVQLEGAESLQPRPPSQ